MRQGEEQTDNMKYFNCLRSMIANDARCTREVKSRISMAKAAFNKKTLSTNKMDIFNLLAPELFF